MDVVELLTPPKTVITTSDASKKAKSIALPTATKSMSNGVKREHAKPNEDASNRPKSKAHVSIGLLKPKVEQAKSHQPGPAAPKPIMAQQSQTPVAPNVVISKAPSIAKPMPPPPVPKKPTPSIKKETAVPTTAPPAKQVVAVSNQPAAAPATAKVACMLPPPPAKPTSVTTESAPEVSNAEAGKVAKEHVEPTVEAQAETEAPANTEANSNSASKTSSSQQESPAGKPSLAEQTTQVDVKQSPEAVPAPAKQNTLPKPAAPQPTTSPPPTPPQAKQPMLKPVAPQPKTPLPTPPQAQQQQPIPKPAAPQPKAAAVNSQVKVGENAKVGKVFVILVKQFDLQCVVNLKFRPRIHLDKVYPCIKR